MCRRTKLERGHELYKDISERADNVEGKSKMFNDYILSPYTGTSSQATNQKGIKFWGERA